MTHDDNADRVTPDASAKEALERFYGDALDELTELDQLLAQSPEPDWPAPPRRRRREVGASVAVVNNFPAV